MQRYSSYLLRINHQTSLEYLLLDLNSPRAALNNLSTQKIKEYSDYWSSIAPQNDYERFQRYLFAFCSVHTTFAGNVSSYLAIKNYNEWAGKPDTLLNLLKNSKGGLHNNRTKFIMQFAQQFWNAPKDFYFTSKKGHIKKRDEIVSKIKGLGLAKVSFALEMIHPLDARVVCGDVHHLRMYGVEGLDYNNSTSGYKVYRQMENHWIRSSHAKGASSYVARCIFWDKLQSKPDSRYWSYTLEKDGADEDKILGLHREQKSTAELSATAS